MIDLLAFEGHFLDHLAPVWRALPRELRGKAVVDEMVLLRAIEAGIEAEAADGNRIRRDGPRHPLPDPGPGPIGLVASYGDIKVGRRLGYRRFAFLEHGAGQSYGGDRRNGRHGSYAGGEDREDVGLFLVPGPDPARRWQEAYPAAIVEAVGCPKLDDLPRKAVPGQTIAISFHWDAGLLPETRSAYGHFASALPELRRRFDLIGHAHPRAADWLRKAYRRAGIESVPEFTEVCRRADVYVCDNSSTLFEFAATGRPVVVLNDPRYRRNVEHGLRFWTAASVGINVDAPVDLVDGIRYALDDPPEAKRERDEALRLVYTSRKGAADRAAGAIASWLREVADGEGTGSVEGDRPPAQRAPAGHPGRR